MTDIAPGIPDSGFQASAITVYWRPGCGFCSGLFRQLDRHEVVYSRVDIWSDPRGAEFVRSVARGSETVPTVSVGPVVMVNPSVDEILRAAAEHAPDSVPAGYEPPEQGRFVRWISSKLDGGRPVG